MPSVISGDANVSATEFGYLDGVTSALQTQMDAKLATATAASTYLPIAGGKILQIVRAADATQRTTTSTSFVDVTGMSVTITPQKSDSAVLIIATFLHEQTSGNTQTTGRLQITDSSNNGISGAEQMLSGLAGLNSYHHRAVTLLARATPATTSAVTYKLRFKTDNAASSCSLLNQLSTGQMYALEVSA